MPPAPSSTSIHNLLLFTLRALLADTFNISIPGFRRADGIIICWEEHVRAGRGRGGEGDNGTGVDEDMMEVRSVKSAGGSTFGVVVNS